jgi:uncharacterized protein (TIGR03437 family)
MQIAWGSCSYDGTNTTCTVSGPFTGLGAGGTYAFTLKYPGNGPTPLTGITNAPGSNYIYFNLSAGSFTDAFTESDGTSVSFTTDTLQFSFVSSTCTGNPSSCSVGAVGSTPGATITGQVSGTFDPTPVIQTAITAQSYGGFASIAPATWVEIYGTNLATTKQVWGSSNFQGNNAPDTLGGTTVTVGGINSFIDYVSPDQVNVQVPSGVPSGQQPVVVTTVGGSSNPFNVNVNALEPGLLAPPAFDIQGTQYVVALFPNQLYVLPPGTIPSIASERAVPGNTIMLFGIGFGPVTPQTLAGVIDQASNQINANLQVMIGGVTADVQYQGLTPTFVGLYQFNVVVPNVPANDKTPLVFTLNGTAGQQTLYLSIGN